MKTLINKWINGKFDAKVVPSLVETDEGYKNIRFSLINGKEYKTKLGNGMGAILERKELGDLIVTLIDIYNYEQEDQVKLTNIR